MKKQTIAQQLQVTDFPFSINNKDGKEIYFEDSDGFWCKNEYDAQSNIIRFENSNGFWAKREYDAHGNQIRGENSTGYWTKSEYDAAGNIIYHETSTGCMIDNRPKDVELTLQQIADKLGINVKQLRIKD